ncbi:sugar porter family MFS transporter [Paraferrimonas sedimenticola]|uniref:Major facilitator superfamily (MFS) profile domain-containing protein n=1 Tax=Paraferrimonas sedimenticola TaxID=375674 RepID=A0AA37VUG6_9GAMM|nr:sugar porter family MFS transporter [Paraferrimonas sedimenticola]GLP95904.1 hypothetical protein GCM10007895_12100 [Paraferrimonas sedimenticola]
MQSQTRYSYQLALIVSLGGFVFGFDASVISGVIGFVSQEFQLSTLEMGWIVSAPTAGSALAALLIGYATDFFGRKRILITIAALYLVSAVFSAFATSFAGLATARFIGGLAFASLIVAPIYIAEVAPAKVRGKMVSFNQMSIVIGFSAAYFANYTILQLSQSGADWVTNIGLDTNVWRYMLGLEALPAALYLLMLFTIEESPRWLVVKGRIDDAKRVLGKLMSPSAISEQLAQLQSHSAGKKQGLLAELKVLFSPRLRLALMLGLAVGIIQQFSGINAVFFYAPTIFEQSGVGTDAAFAQAVWIGLTNVIFTVVAIMLIDRLGRKPLMLMGLVGVFVSMSIIAYGFAQGTYVLTPEVIAQLPQALNSELLNPLVNHVFESDIEYKQALIALLGDSDFRAHESALIQAAANLNSTLILAGITGFVASFAVSLGPVMWVLLSEIFPNHIRGIAIAFVGVFNSGSSFLVQQFFPWQLANLGSATTFLCYGLFALVGLVVVSKMLPETRGKSLEELEDMLCKEPEAEPQGVKA